MKILGFPFKKTFAKYKNFKVGKLFVLSTFQRKKLFIYSLGNKYST